MSRYTSLLIFMYLRRLQNGQFLKLFVPSTIGHCGNKHLFVPYLFLVFTCRLCFQLKANIFLKHLYRTKQEQTLFPSKLTAVMPHASKVSNVYVALMIVMWHVKVFKKQGQTATAQRLDDGCCHSTCLQIIVIDIWQVLSNDFYQSGYRSVMLDLCQFLGII